MPRNFLTDLNQQAALEKFQVFSFAWATRDARPEELTGPNTSMVRCEKDAIIMLGSPVGTDEFENLFCLLKAGGDPSETEAPKSQAVRRATTPDATQPQKHRPPSKVNAQNGQGRLSRSPTE